MTARTRATALVLERLEDRSLPDAGLAHLLALADPGQAGAAAAPFASAADVKQYLMQQALRHYDDWVGQPHDADWFGRPLTGSPAPAGPEVLAATGGQNLFVALRDQQQ